MLRSLQDLEGCALSATDGPIGHVTDCYFDDEQWVLRFLVVETGSWLASRKVLISPYAIGQPDWHAKVLPVSITREQVRSSPDVDTGQPVSRHHALQILSHFGFPSFWLGAGSWGSAEFPGAMLTGVGCDDSGAQYLAAQVAAAPVPELDSHLRSANALLRYHIEAGDGGLGPVKGLLFDEDGWEVRYLIVDTSNWWLGHPVLIAPAWIRELRWADATISVLVNRRAVQDAPAYDPSVPLDREQEARLFAHHGRAAYWSGEVRRENAQFRASRPTARY
jgi:hypothetical protein